MHDGPLELQPLRSFKNRILILIVALVTLAQGVTLLLTLASLRQSSEEQSRRDLVAAKDVLQERLSERWRERHANAEAIFRDFTFLEVLGTGNAPTINSALDNLAHTRLGADRSAVFDAEGRFVAGDAAAFAQGSDWLPEEGAAEQHVNYTAIAGEPYQLVFAELRSPQHVGWVALAFALDDSLAEQLKRLAIADVKFELIDPAHQPAGIVVRAGDQFSLSTALPHSDGTVAIIVRRSVDTAMNTFGKNWQRLTFIVAAILLLAAGFGVLLGRAFVRPLATLVAAAGRIARGDYGWLVPPQGGEEFQAVASTFNIMQDGIREREQQLYLQATRDALTGLSNRRAIKQWLEQRESSDLALSLVVCDVNRFRDVNASMGNQTGDRVLCLLAQRLKLLAGDVEACARLGADLFAVALPMAGAAAATTVRQLIAELHAGVALDGVQLSINLRCGIAVLQPGIGAEDLLRQCGVALVEAKESGQDCVAFKISHDLEHQRRVMLVAELRRAIADNGLTLNWQPLVQMSNRDTRLMEVLVRWSHPTLGDIPPAEFVPLAERASAIGDLSRWVMQAAIEQLGRWRREGVELEAAVNLSAADMSDPTLPMRVLLLLQQQEVSPSKLVLEVTESAIMREPVQAAHVMKQLRVVGVRFAIDDFGTGHSSLAQLTALPVDELKIDRTFVRDLDRNSANQAIVRSTIELGHILGLKVVAEGIETPEVWAQLMRMGCDYAQGYFISRPMPTAAVAEWLATQRERLAETLSAAERSGQLAAIRPRRI
jgi:diguanylate cyclase (GGDEF)-like protein